MRALIKAGGQDRIGQGGQFVLGPVDTQAAGHSRIKVKQDPISPIPSVFVVLLIYTGLKIQRLKDVSEANYNAKIDCETLRDVLGINQSIHRYLTVHGLFSVRYLSVKSSGDRALVKPRSPW
ncbi:hypothetical protein J6590_048600 [Homalodisca vitripennis]|nr:hypothetical protein J6590_048600 [Homalodisca vitripennis]